MKRLERILLLWFWIVLGLVGVPQTLYLYRMLKRPMTFLPALELGLLFSALWLVFTPGMLAMARRFPLEKPHLIRNLLIHTPISMVFGATNRVLFVLLAQFLPWVAEPTLTIKALFNDMVLRIDVQAFLYWMVVLLHTGLAYYVRNTELSSQLAQSQLQALKMQLQPHFLFNTLNTISSMIHVDTRAADLMVVRLSEFLRLSLENAGAGQVPLEEEMHFVERYLEIEKIRFEDRLQIDFEIARETLRASVPNLILQPLVENAVRHGVARVARNARIVIQSSAKDGNLFLKVQDNGAGISSNGGGPRREGVGLANTRARLQTLYGEDQSFDLQPGREGGAEATLRMPLRFIHENHESSDRR